MKKKSCGTEAKLEEFMIYDPKWIFDVISDNSINTPTESKLMTVMDYALAFVGERMLELQKEDLWDDLYGRQLVKET